LAGDGDLDGGIVESDNPVSLGPTWGASLLRLGCYSPEIRVELIKIKKSMGTGIFHEKYDQKDCENGGWEAPDDLLENRN